MYSLSCYVVSSLHMSSQEPTLTALKYMGSNSLPINESDRIHIEW